MHKVMMTYGFNMYFDEIDPPNTRRGTKAGNEICVHAISHVHELPPCSRHEMRIESKGYMDPLIETHL
jgi:hypothetical protein